MTAIRRNKPKRGNYAFIDSQNLNVSVQNYGWKMNWRKFREFLSENYGVTKAFMFIGYMPQNEDLYEKMHEAGFAVVLKPTFDMTRVRPEEAAAPKAGEPEKKVKGNVDADLVLWATKEMPNYDKAVIVSGDGDFYSLLEYLVSQNKLLKILTPSVQYSSLFRKFEPYLERVDDHRRTLAYYDKKPVHKKPTTN